MFGGFFSTAVTFRVPVSTTPQVAPQVAPQVRALLKAAAQTPVSRVVLQKIVGLKDRERFRKTYLKPLLEAGWLAMTAPDKPLSARQRYMTTPTGLEKSESS